MAVAIALQASAADFLQGVTLTPVGAYKTADFVSGKSEWGAGVDLGLPVNLFVSIHVRNLAFQGPGQSTTTRKTSHGFESVTTGQRAWGGSAIDETTLYGRADFAKFYDEKLKLFGTGGGTRYWETEEWGFGVGLGVEYRFTDHISAQASEEIWAKTQGSKQWLSTFGVSYRF